ncbi:Hypothetical protein NTJ_09777 [Nesidiocoris tenuis]|uniref:Odorant receptor n=1 Tax=Nesidiocoris tenuis TaxID=355587 RepID=A0ABN7AY82_9HEMI|nr:Hypothetical protein NTJ_09777 [Nesidiocoris tenuis]
MYALYLGGLKKAMGIELFQSLMGFLTALQMLFIVRKSKLIGDIVDSIRNMREDFPVFTDNEFQQRMAPAWKVARAYIAAMNIYMVCYLVIPRAYDLTIGALLGTPLWSHRLPATIASMVDGEGQTRDFQYVWVTLVTITWLPMSAYAHVGFDSCLILFGFYYSTLIDGFAQRLQEFDTSLTPSQRTEFVKTTAAHNRAIYMLSRKLKMLFGYPFALQNLLGAFIIVSLIFSVLPNRNHEPFVVNVTQYINILFLSSMLGATAYAGQHITNQSSKLFDSMYSFPWYELNPSDRKYFISMICSSREELKIDFYGMLALNYETLTVMGNTACSYLTFMMSML